MAGKRRVGDNRLDSVSIDTLLYTLGHVDRIEILLKLAEGALDVTSLAEQMELDVSTISKHLKRLARTKLVSKTTYGSRHVYALNGRTEITFRRDFADVACCTGSGEVVHLHVEVEQLGRSR